MSDIIALDHVDVTFHPEKNQEVKAVQDVSLHVAKGDV